MKTVHACHQVDHSQLKLFSLSVESIKHKTMRNLPFVVQCLEWRTKNASQSDRKCSQFYVSNAQLIGFIFFGFMAEKWP